MWNSPFPKGAVQMKRADLTHVPTACCSACSPHCEFISCLRFWVASPSSSQSCFLIVLRRKWRFQQVVSLVQLSFLRIEGGLEFRASDSNFKTFSSTLQTVTNDIRIVCVFS